jgi:hypothetical protein
LTAAPNQRDERDRDERGASRQTQRLPVIPGVGVEVRIWMARPLQHAHYLDALPEVSSVGGALARAS